jgi:hypothetical protein
VRPIRLALAVAGSAPSLEAWQVRVRRTPDQKCASGAGFGEPQARQTHVGEETVFVDFAGAMIDVVDPACGNVQAMRQFAASPPEPHLQARPHELAKQLPATAKQPPAIERNHSPNSADSLTGR